MSLQCSKERYKDVGPKILSPIFKEMLGSLIVELFHFTFAEWKKWLSIDDNPPSTTLLLHLLLIFLWLLSLSVYC